MKKSFLVLMFICMCFLLLFSNASAFNHETEPYALSHSWVVNQVTHTADKLFFATLDTSGYPVIVCYVEEGYDMPTFKQLYGYLVIGWRSGEYLNRRCYAWNGSSWGWIGLSDNTYLHTPSDGCPYVDTTHDIYFNNDSYNFGSNYCNLGSVIANQLIFPKNITTYDPTPFSFPLDGSLESRTILSGFSDNWLEYCDGQIKKHTGIDIEADEDEAVYAAEAGVVKVAQTDQDWGGWATIEHDNSFTTVYWHITPSVSVDDTVDKGDQIGEVVDYGDTVHLHFGLRTGAYSNISNRGALPQSICDGDPAFPENFVDPETLSFE